MAERNERGSRSPASEEAKEQRLTGHQGGPRASREGESLQGQPPQGSGRRGAAKEEEPRLRKGFEEGRAPSEQGDGTPGPEKIASGGQQGISAQSGSHSARGERVQEEAVRGEPRSEHIREGRQKAPGDRQNG